MGRKREFEGLFGRANGSAGEARADGISRDGADEQSVVARLAGGPIGSVSLLAPNVVEGRASLGRRISLGFLFCAHAAANFGSRISPLLIDTVPIRNLPN